MIGQTVSHYKILKKLGEGGMGIVYKAHDTKLDRKVALKFLPHYLTTEVHEKERLYHEARAASALMHANVAVIFEINEFEEQIYLAMEFVDGQTLKKLIEQDDLSIKKVLDIAIQACKGLAAAHEKGIVHRDIKPDNIMITPKGQVKIMDFGLAKVKGATKLTKAGSTLGTAAYMSPEQARGEEVDHRSDIFSFGVVFYELLTTKLPFRGEHQAALMYSLINEEPQSIARFNEKVTPDLERIVMKTLAKDKEERYQHIEDLLADLRRERKNLEHARAGYATTSAISAATQSLPTAAPPMKKSVLRYIIPAGLIVVAVALFMIFNLFNFQIGTQKSSTADHNSLAVMYFENVADPQDQDKTAKMITSLLITGLSESKGLNVISTQRLYDILKQLGREDSRVIDKGVASEVAKKAGVSVVVTGEILQSKPNIVLTAQVSEVDGGKILAAEKIVGTGGDDVFTIVDKLSANIKNSLLSSRQTETEPKKTVADITTHSPEAYKDYLEGVESLHKLYRAEAEQHFSKAVRTDSTFAMAYLGLAINNIGNGQLSKEYIQKAVRYSDHITRKEREFLRAFEAIFVNNDRQEGIRRLQDFVANFPDDKDAYLYLGVYLRNGEKYSQAIEAFNKVVDLDPYYKSAYNLLAYTYDDAGDFEKSLWAINKYISLAPDEANPYDTQGDLYAGHGKLRNALDSYTKALAKKPDFFGSLFKLGQMYMFLMQYKEVDSCIANLIAGEDQISRNSGRQLSIVLSLYQGKLRDALTETQKLLTADKKGLSIDQQLGYHYWRADIYSMMKNPEAAVAEADQIVQIYKKNNINGPAFGQGDYATYLADNGEVERAEGIAEEIKKDADPADSARLNTYWFIRGCIERAKGNTTPSLAAFLNAVSGSKNFYDRMQLGRAYLNANKLAEAVAEFERLKLNYLDIRRAESFINYYLGIAYEKSGWNDKAIEEYGEFLEIMKNADKGIPEVEDARLRLVNLKNKV